LPIPGAGGAKSKQGENSSNLPKHLFGDMSSPIRLTRHVMMNSDIHCIASRKRINYLNNLLA